MTDAADPFDADALFRLRGKVALVVGGGQGMGEASAIALARCGCRVAVVDLELERAARVVNRIRHLSEAEAFQANALDDADAERTVLAAWKRFGRLDILVTIIGQATYIPLLEMSAEDWDRDHKLNLRYVFVWTKAFTARLAAAAAAGNIVAIASVSGVQSAPKHAAYGAAKAGLVNLVKSMAVEWSPLGIRVNAVAPGSIATPRRPDSEARRKEVAASLIPMRRRGAIEDIASAVLFLSSGMSDYVTGHTLLVDGGWMAAAMYQR